MASDPDPESNEIMVTLVDLSDDLHIIRWNGATLSLLREISTSLQSDDYGCSAVVYEQQSGNALIIWSESNSRRLSFAIWDGTTLGDPVAHPYNAGANISVIRAAGDPDSDFIFAAISEEFGFVGAAIVIGMLFFIIYRCLRAAQLAQDSYGALICYGVATLIAFQTLVNIGMNLKLLPVTGLPLPLISQGGSSLLSIMLGIGLVESVVSRHKTALD